MRILSNIGGLEQKSASKRIDFMSFYEFLSKGSWNDLAAHQAIQYYKQVGPLFHGIDLISDEVASIKPLLWDKKAEKFVESHKMIDKLSRPNAFTTGEDFIKELVTYYLITGNLFYTATGNLTREPLELISVSPTRMTASVDERDGYVDAYQLTGRNNQVFDRSEINRQFHFVNREQDQELFHVKNFNVTDDAAFGMSKFTPIFYDIEQYLQSSTHNLSLLKNGATLSGVMSTEKNLNDDQYARLVAEMERFFQGARNAGRPMVAEGGLKYTNMSMNNKDMDFRNLKKDTIDMMYLILRIPLPYVSREQMTMSNYEEAKYPLYDNAILPIWKFLYSNIGDHLMQRFKLDPDQYELRYDEDEISALKERHIKETERKVKMGIFTMNELRQMSGYGEIEGGNDVYQPMNLVPLGRDLDTSDQTQEDKDLKLRFELFEKQLKSRVNEDGKRVYSDEEIKFLAQDQGLL